MTVRFNGSLAAAAFGLALMSQPDPAAANNTLNGAECVAAHPNDAQHLEYASGNGVRGLAQVAVVCPIIKANHTSTGKVKVGVAAGLGTKCRLISFEVVSDAFKASPEQTFPGAITGLTFEIPESLRGALALLCTLPANGRILNYVTQED